MFWVRVVSFLIAFLLVPAANAATAEGKKRVRATITPATAGILVRGTTKSDKAQKGPAAGRSSRNSAVASARDTRRAVDSKVARYAKLSPRPRRMMPYEEEDPTNLSVRSAAALVFDLEQGQPVYEKNPGSVMPIASITKLMTAMVVLDAQLPLEQPITITDDDLDAM
jgi:D-alanyl-D-alanine endopeptidase (penicillin-binding protein 7)